MNNEKISPWQLCRGEKSIYHIISNPSFIFHKDERFCLEYACLGLKYDIVLYLRGFKGLKWNIVLFLLFDLLFLLRK